MSAEVVPGAGSMPRRARHLIPTQLPRRGEVVAAFAVLVLLSHLLFAQLTLVLAAAFVAVSKTTRWRLWWLAAPAAAGLAWTLAIGPRAAAAGFAAGPAQILAYLGGGHPLNRLLHAAWRVRRRGRLAAEAVPARADRGRRRSRAGRLAGLDAHRRVGRQAAAAWSTRGGPRRAGQADDQRRCRRHQGRLRARRRAGQRCPGGARLARDRGRSAGDRRGCQDARGKQPAGGARRAAPAQAADRA